MKIRGLRHPCRFNPRVLAGGRDVTRRRDFLICGFQSTRPRGRTRRSKALSAAEVSVSIHASSREDATMGAHCDRLEKLVSIHASSREDATSSGYTRASFGVFQSTRPRGRTRQSGESVKRRIIVSIHASSREDATYFASGSIRLLRFQSTRPRGRTRPHLH